MRRGRMLCELNPSEVIEKMNSENLDEAFMKYCAICHDEAVESEKDFVDGPHFKTESSMLLQVWRLQALLIKNFLQGRRRFE